MYVRAQLASLRRFRRRARAVGDVHGSPRFTIGLATLAFDAETHDFWHVVTCQRCAASEERTVHDLSEIGTERLYVCGDCAQVPLQGGPRDDASIDPMVPSAHRPGVPDASSLSVTQNGDAAATAEAADEKPGQASSAERRATEERSEAARAEGAARDAAAVVAQAELHATELGNDAVRFREAAEIQQSLLLDELPEFPGYELAARSVPTEEVGGDFFDFIPFDGELLGLAIGDASGHGRPSALLVRDLVTGLRMGIEREL